jgi:hypothetical protein
VFCYTSWHFYAFSRTNLLTRCHSVSSLFLLFLCFRKATQEIFSELDETKAKVPIFPEASRSLKQRRRGARGRPHHPMAQAAPGLGVGPWSTSWRRPSAYIFPSMRKPKSINQFPRNILQATVVVDARSGGSISSFRHPAGEGNHRRRPPSSPCLPPEWCVSILPWTTGP